MLIDASREAGLLVGGSRGHGAWHGMLAGPVSIHRVTGALCPVVVVRGDDAHAGHGGHRARPPRVIGAS